MLIIYKVDGGFAYFPGLSEPHTIDTAKIDPALAAEIESMLNKTHFFEKTAQISTPAPGAADYRTYTITVEHDKGRHVVQAVEPVGNPEVFELIEYLEGLVRSNRLK